MGQNAFSQMRLTLTQDADVPRWIHKEKKRPLTFSILLDYIVMVYFPNPPYKISLIELCSIFFFYAHGKCTGNRKELFYVKFGRKFYSLHRRNLILDISTLGPIKHLLSIRAYTLKPSGMVDIGNRLRFYSVVQIPNPNKLHRFMYRENV